MGSFRGHRIPDDYNPFWEEPEYKDKPDWWHWYHLGYQDGKEDIYTRYSCEENSKLAQENGQLKALIKANTRVNSDYDDWLKKELQSVE